MGRVCAAQGKILKKRIDERRALQVLLTRQGPVNPKETNEVFDKYFDVAASVSLTMFQTIAADVSDPNSKAFLYVKNHRGEFSQVAGKEAVDNYI